MVIHALRVLENFRKLSRVFMAKIPSLSSSTKEVTRNYANLSAVIIKQLTGGFTEQYGGVFATPGVVEKGYIDVKVDVTSPGGHSSVPPIHTVYLRLSFDI